MVKEIATTAIGTTGGSDALTTSSVTIGSATATDIPANVVSEAQCRKIDGKLGQSSQWNAAWLELPAGTSFRSGSRLRLTVGGDARRVYIRLLPKGASADGPIGVLGEFDVPDRRIVEVRVDRTRDDIVQISVHGSPKLWGTLRLGSRNGSVTLEEVKYCRPVASGVALNTSKTATAGGRIAAVSADTTTWENCLSKVRARLNADRIAAK
jgi:hypothetical protein